MIQWEWKENNIGPEGAKSFIESLKINASLTLLNLNGDEMIRNELKKTKEMVGEWKDNHIGDEGAESLGEALRIKTSLIQLDLASDEEMWNEMKELK